MFTGPGGEDRAASATSDLGLSLGKPLLREQRVSP